MHMQPFEIVANALAILALAIVAAINLYGRRRFESPDGEPDRMPEPRS